MKALRTLTAAGLTLLLAACADMGHIAPQSQKLNVAALNAGSAIKAATAPVAWPDEAWWDALHDAQLNKLVAAALADNPSLHVTQARVRQAESLAGVVEAEDKIQVKADAATTRTLFSTDGTAPPPLNGTWQWLNTASVSASYNIDAWGRNRAALAAALDEVQLTSAESQMARLSLETAVVRGYIQLSLEYAIGDTIADSLAQRQRILDITRRRRAAGLASDIDVTTIETTLPAGRRALEQSQESIALLRNQLAALIGKGPGDGEAIARPTLKLEHGTGLPANLPAELLGRRPDIVAQRWRVEAASKHIDVAKASFYPNINFAMFAGFESFGFTNFLSAQSAVRGFEPAISLPIFDGGRLRGQLGNQTAIYDGAVEQYNATVVQALSEVANAVTRIHSTQEQERLTQNALASAQRAHTLADKAYRAGMTDSLNEISTRIALLNEQQQVAQISSRQLDNFATLMAALGGGIKLDLPEH